MIGIYKITCLKNKRVYVGQSRDIDSRFTSYKALRCKNQPRLYSSFKKYGVDKHKFEIVTECDEVHLNKWERYYQDLYSATGRKSGLNCLLTGYNDRPQVNSIETRLKIGASNKGKIISQETRDKISKSTKGIARHTPETIAKLKMVTRSDEYKNNLREKALKRYAEKGISEETRLKMSLAQIGKKITPEQRKAISERMKGQKRSLGYRFSEEQKKLMSEARKGVYRPWVSGFNSVFSKNVFDPEMGIFYANAREAAAAFGIRTGTLSRWLSGESPSKTRLVYAY